MSLNRRDFLKSSSAAAGAALLAPGLSAAAAGGAKTNLLFVLADQWRSTAFGHGNDGVVRTPNIDKLATQGALWQRAYASNPVCTPNRSCILTGRFSHETGMTHNDIMLPPSEICWPEVFRDAGYATHYIGKWHMDGSESPGYVPPGWRRRGFTTFEGFNRGHVYHTPYGFDDAGGPLFAKWRDQGDPYYEPTLQTDLAINFMQQNREKPFCCYLSWGPPHTPFKPPKKFDLYKPGDIKFRPNVPDDQKDQAAKDLAGYYGLCESLDHEMGRLMQFLETSGLADETLVVFSADHGELAGSHGKIRKGEPEDESLNIPMLMRLPGRIAAGARPKTLISSVDLMPTMLSICALKDPGTCTGRNKSGAILNGGKAPDVECIYAEGKLTGAEGEEGGGEEGGRKRPRNNSPINTTWRTIVTDRHKLVLRNGPDNVYQMFDLRNDPYELENLANEPAHRSLQSDLLTELRDWGKRTGDVYPQKPVEAKVLYSDAEAEKARG